MNEAESPRLLETVNRAGWADVTDEYAVEGWNDPGELGALTYVADRVRGLPVLDVGVGGGRTAALLRLLTDDYLGIDYTPEFVALARSRHPGVRFALGDARDLDGIPDNSRGFVLFSFNGIDAVDHEDRQLVMASVHRVLQPGGTFLFSTPTRTIPCTAPTRARPPRSRGCRALWCRLLANRRRPKATTARNTMGGSWR